MRKSKVIYIDDIESARNVYSRRLKRIYGDEFDIVAPEPLTTMSKMLTYCYSLGDVVAFIIDERLKVSGVATYIGTELAQAIRDIDSKIPVYILTSFEGDVGLTGNIEYVIDKNDISDPDKKDKIAQRLRRQLNIYNDIKSQRASRLDELLKKSMCIDLTEKEETEFNQLNLIRMKPILLEEHTPSNDLKKKLDEQEELLAKIEAKLRDLN